MILFEGLSVSVVEDWCGEPCPPCFDDAQHDTHA